MAKETTVLCTFIIVIIILIKVSMQSLQDDLASQMNSTGRSLSRKKRYLVFPEGSSLQLVFCLTIPSVGMGNIFTIGSTAALAWELPHEPFLPFKKKHSSSEAKERIDDKPARNDRISGGSNRVGGWTLLENDAAPSPFHSQRLPMVVKAVAPVNSMKTYYNPFLINKPTSSYNTINRLPLQSTLYRKGAATTTTTINSWGKVTSSKPSVNTLRKSNYNTINPRLPIKKNYRISLNQPKKVSFNEPVTSYLHPVYHRVYRRTRRDLYTKIERLFTAMSRDGTACVLKTVCEVSKSSQERGTFMQEILKAIFRVRHPEDSGEDEKDKYDWAAQQNANCTQMYPECELSVWGSLFSHLT